MPNKETDAERPGSYAQSREKQADFEALEREEGDWQEAVDDVEEGKEPADDKKRPASSGA